jgi:hypothetical protein
MTASVPADPIGAGPVSVTVTLSPDPGGGTVRYALSGGFPPTTVPVGPGGVTVIDLGSLTPSHYTYTFEFSGFGAYAGAETTLAFSVWYRSTTSLSADRATAVAGELPVTLTATVATGNGGTVSFEDVVGGATIVLGPVALDPYSMTATYASSGLRVGVHTIRAIYSGSDWYLGSTSDPVTVTVSADTSVRATFKPSLTTVYPYRDSFRDTVQLGGVLSERATVGVKVYDRSNRLKRTFSLGWKGPGSFAAAWNGRTAAGSPVAAGRYRAVASLRDVRGNTRTLAAFVTVSWRHATWKSVTVTRYADQGTYYVDANGLGKLYYSPDYPHGIILDSGSMIRDCQGCGWVGGRFTFSLTAAIEYRSIYVQFRGHSFTDREHPGSMSLENATTQALEFGYSMCDDAPGLTCGLTASSRHISAAHRLAAWVTMTQQWGDAFDLWYLRLTYKYAVLR